MAQDIKVVVTYTSDKASAAKRLAQAWADLIADRINNLPVQHRLPAYAELIKQIDQGT